MIKPLIKQLSLTCGVVYLSAILTIFLACQDAFAQDANNKSSNSPELIAMFNKNWQLKSIAKSGEILFEPEKEPGNKIVTLLIDPSCKVSGRSVINRYFGQCELGENSAIKWKEPGFGMTMMAGPPEDMDAEQLYLKHLKQTDKIIIKESTLELHSDDGKLRLVFELEPK